MREKKLDKKRERLQKKGEIRGREREAEKEREMRGTERKKERERGGKSESSQPVRPNHKGLKGLLVVGLASA